MLALRLPCLGRCLRTRAQRQGRTFLVRLGRHLLVAMVTMRLRLEPLEHVARAQSFPPLASPLSLSLGGRRVAWNNGTFPDFWLYNSFFMRSFPKRRCAGLSASLAGESVCVRRAGGALGIGCAFEGGAGALVWADPPASQYLQLYPARHLSVAGSVIIWARAARKMTASEGRGAAPRTQPAMLQNWAGSQRDGQRGPRGATNHSTHVRALWEGKASQSAPKTFQQLL